MSGAWSNALSNETGPGKGNEPGKVSVRQRVRLPLAGASVVPECISFNGLAAGDEPVALVFGEPDFSGPVWVRLHSECLTGDALGSQRCDCGPQLQDAIHQLSLRGGVLLYLRQEGRGIGLYAKLDAYHLQSQGRDTFAANRELGFADDLRNYASAAAMLQALGISRVRLITNNPSKAQQLTANGLEVVQVEPTAVHLTPHNHQYLWAKQALHAHTLDLAHDPVD